MKKDKKSVKIYSLCLILFFICIFMHFFKISTIPFGINVDEMGMGYDAYCLSHFGVDRYLKSFPVYLTNFGGGQSALYAYLCSFILKFTDLSVVVMRLPGIILFLISVVCIWKTMKMLDPSYDRGMWVLFLISISPVYILLFRIGMDCNLMLAVTGIFFYFLIKAVQSGKHLDFILAGIWGGILLYTYAISYLVLLLFLVLFLVYLYWIKKIRFSNVLLFAGAMGVLAAPLILVQFVNMFDLDEMHLGIFTITKLSTYRRGEIRVSNMNWEFIWRSICAIFLYDELPYNSIPKFGNVYYVSLPFIFVGLSRGVCKSVRSICRREWDASVIYVTWFLILMVLGFMMEANVNRLNGIYITIIYFEAEGILWFLNFLKNNKARYMAAGAVIIIYLCFFARFSIYYFGGEYENDYEPLPYFGYSLEEPLDYLKQSEAYRNRVTYMGELCENYIYFLGANRPSPTDYYFDGLKNGDIKERRREDFLYAFQNYRFGLKDAQIDRYTNYIVNENDKDWRKLLLEEGFLEHKIGHYNVYTYDVEQLDRTDDGYLEWDAGADEKNVIHLSNAFDVQGEQCVVLVGWGYNKKNDCTWDEVHLLVGDKIFKSEVVERADVVERTEKENLLNTGILLIVPKELLDSAEEAMLVTIDLEHGMYRKVIMPIKE